MSPEEHAPAAAIAAAKGTSSQRPWVQPIAVIVVVVLSVVAAKVMIDSKDEPVSTPPPTVEPLVEVVTVSIEPVRLQVRTLGELRPRREGSLTPEIAGRVVSLSDDLVEGGRITAGAVLAELDGAPLQVGLKRAQASLAQAKAIQSQVQAEAARSVQEWKRAGRTGEPPPLVAKGPALAEAEATVEAAEAVLAEAELDLTRSKLVAPFTGIVRTVAASVGGYVQAGQTLATLYESDPMEIRFALTERELSRLDRMALIGRDVARPSVQFTGRFAGQEGQYTAKIVRMDGEVDPASRMVRLIAEVAAPTDPAVDRAPLLAGVFVDASIEGRLVERACRVPATALFEPGLCLVLGKEGRIERRPVLVALMDGKEAIIESGLVDGERIVVSPLDIAVDGMAVRTVPARPAARTAPGGGMPDGGPAGGPAGGRGPGDSR